MNEIKYQLLKLKERLVIGFFHRMPNRFLYWAVNEAWARLTTKVFTDRSPNEVSFEMTQRYLSGRPQRTRDRKKPSLVEEQNLNYANDVLTVPNESL